MGWEERNGRSYYYKKRRDGARVVSEYVGAGPLAVVSSQWDDQERSDRARERAVRRRAEVQLDGHLRRALDLAALLTRASLLASGAHTHRGQWRRRRTLTGRPIVPPTDMAEHRQSLQAESNGAVVTVPAPAHYDAEAVEHLRKVMDRTNKADPKPADVAALRAALDAYPGLWRLAGDAAAGALGAVVKMGSGDNVLLRESLRRRVAMVADELRRPEDGPLEKLLIEQVAVTWLNYHVMQRSLAEKTSQRHALEIAAHYERRTTQAQGRHLRAVLALARVRRLGRPSILVNVAADGGTFQQVNASG